MGIWFIVHEYVYIASFPSLIANKRPKNIKVLNELFLQNILVLLQYLYGLIEFHFSGVRIFRGFV